jgi:hypothetical protein
LGGGGFGIVTAPTGVGAVAGFTVAAAGADGIIGGSFNLIRIFSTPLGSNVFNSTISGGSGSGSTPPSGSSGSTTPSGSSTPSPTKLSKETFESLAFDPAKGKISPASIEELRTGLAAERAGLIDKIKFRGDPKFPGTERGFEFTTKSGKEFDVKAFRPNSLSNPKELIKFGGKFKGNNVKILLDPRNLTPSEIETIIMRAESVGIGRDRFIVVPRESFAPIDVGGTIF